MMSTKRVAVERVFIRLKNWQAYLHNLRGPSRVTFIASCRVDHALSKLQQTAALKQSHEALATLQTNFRNSHVHFSMLSFLRAVLNLEGDNVRQLIICVYVWACL